MRLLSSNFEDCGKGKFDILGGSVALSNFRALSHNFLYRWLHGCCRPSLRLLAEAWRDVGEPLAGHRAVVVPVLPATVLTPTRYLAVVRIASVVALHWRAALADCSARCIVVAFAALVHSRHLRAGREDIECSGALHFSGHSFTSATTFLFFTPGAFNWNTWFRAL